MSTDKASLGPQAPHILALGERVGRLGRGDLRRLREAAEARGSNQASAVSRAQLLSMVVGGAPTVGVGGVISAGDRNRVDAALDAIIGGRDAGLLREDAIRDAASGLALRDELSAEDYDTLTGPWRTVIGRLHPDDPPLA